MRDARGFTLIEVVTAMTLVAVVGLTVSSALLAGRAVAAHEREQAIGQVAAHARLATLMSLAFERVEGPGGAALSVTDTSTDVTTDTTAGTGLSESPADALWVDHPGYVDYLDATGRALGAGAGAAASAVYVRRWAIGRQGAGSDVASIAVLVAPLAVAYRVAAGDPSRLVDQPGVVVRRGARMRQAS
jgi:prepilin-type N-terminal cleavage/methylation domain-containing protein